jgi:hypothetical protein
LPVARLMPEPLQHLKQDEIGHDDADQGARFPPQGRSARRPDGNTADPLAR